MAGTQRYVRYILIAFLCSILIWFISTTPDPRERLQSASDYIKSHGGLSKANELAEAPIEEIIPEEPVSLPDEGQKPELNPEPEHKDPAKEDEHAGSPKEDEHKEAPTEDEPKIDEKKDEEKKDDDKKGDEKKKDDEAAKPEEPTSPRPGSDLPPPKEPGERMNATFVTLARNSDVWEIAKSIRQVEDRFNRKFNYDWVFLNDKEFDAHFKKVTTALVSGKTRYGVIPKDQWSFPEWIDKDKAAKVREDMKKKEIIYGDSVSYRHMCRYESGFFFRHPIMQEYEWYWRVEPSIKFFCDINYDTFKFMADNGKKYSFVISLYEYKETIPTLWDSVKGFMKEFPHHIAQNNSMKWVSNDNGDTYNNCHFWSNFEIGNLNWLRSDAYMDYFNKLDHDGGFFYERWGDAPVHSIAAALMLPKDQIHFFNDIAYYHIPFMHCPTGEDYRMDHKCHCQPSDNFDWNGYSCTKRFYEVNHMKLPEGWGEGN